MSCKAVVNWNIMLICFVYLLTAIVISHLIKQIQKYCLSSFAKYHSTLAHLSCITNYKFSYNITDCWTFQLELKWQTKWRFCLNYIWTIFKIAIQWFYLNLLKILLVIFAWKMKRNWKKDNVITLSCGHIAYHFVWSNSLTSQRILGNEFFWQRHINSKDYNILRLPETLSLNTYFIATDNVWCCRAVWGIVFMFNCYLRWNKLLTMDCNFTRYEILN